MIKKLRQSELAIDTNVLIHNLSYLATLESFTILKSVVVELDRLKEVSAVSKRARAALRFLQENTEKFKFVDDKVLLGEAVDADNNLFAYAKKTKCIVATNDKTLQLLLTKEGLDFVSVVEHMDESYSGIIKIPETEDVYADEKAAITKFNLREGTYVIYGEGLYVIKNGKFVSIFQDGEAKHLEFKNLYVDKIKPRNLEQKFAFHALRDTSAKVVALIGGYGVGKTLLSFCYALEEVERGRAQKIVLIPNNSQSKDSMAFGYLPGDLEEKAGPLFASLGDILGDKMEIDRLINNQQLEVVPIGFARGRSFENSIVFVNEAQNLTLPQVLLILSRIGEGSKLIFDGDLKQTDQEIFARAPGLKAITQIADTSAADMFRLVTMQKVERGKTAQIADVLEKHLLKI
jgi:predicted ribonuclease YlaK